MPDLAQIARDYACSHGTAARWKREKAPLDDPVRMRSWLLGRKNTPRATRLLLEAESRARRIKVARKVIATDDDSIDGTGAAPALRRLELVEEQAYIRFQQAQETGDDLVELKLAREAWLRIGDSLRKYDLLVEQSRRDRGELLNKGEVLTHVQNLFTTLKQAIVRTASDLALDLAATTTPVEAHDTARAAQ